MKSGRACKWEFICISRPRCFGKSTAANMITAYVLHSVFINIG